MLEGKFKHVLKNSGSFNLSVPFLNPIQTQSSRNIPAFAPEPGLVISLDACRNRASNRPATIPGNKQPWKRIIVYCDLLAKPVRSKYSYTLKISVLSSFLRMAHGQNLQS